MKRKRQFSSPKGIKPAVERPKKKPFQLGTNTTIEEEGEEDAGDDDGEVAIPATTVAAAAEDTALVIDTDTTDDTTITTVDDMRRFINQKVSEINKDLTVIRQSCWDLINVAITNYSPPPPATQVISQMNGLPPMVPPTLELLEQRRLQLQRDICRGGGISGGSNYQQQQHQQQQQPMSVALFPGGGGGGGGSTDVDLRPAATNREAPHLHCPHPQIQF